MKTILLQVRRCSIDRGLSNPVMRPAPIGYLGQGFTASSLKRVLPLIALAWCVQVQAAAPAITSISLGAEGSTNQTVVDRFTLGYSTEMESATVNALANYDLRGAGGDGVFGNDDDVRSYVLGSPGYSSGLSNTFVISNGPLQPGWYRFTATTNLTDRAGNRLAANFVRTFWVVPRAGFTIENRDNDNSAGATPLTLVEDPSGLRWRVGQGNLATSSDVDWWVFNGSAGQVVAVAMDAPGDPPGANWSCTLYRPDGNSLTGIGCYPRGTLGPVTLPDAGEYRVQVSRYSTWYPAEYWVRVSVAVPPVQMESEDNGAVSKANPLVLAPGLGGSQTARVAGCVETNDTAGDYFALGTLGAGVTVNLDLTQPASSPLVGQLTLYKEGTYVALGNDGETHLGYVIPGGEGGQYYARVKAAQASYGVLSQYVLNVNVTNDVVRPVITGVSFGAEGSTNQGVVDRFTLTFSEDMHAATVNALTSYDLRGAGGDGVFGNDDDV
ncbi:MAG: pre-peptidase C-terminal domain-containing protein, partial [Verrucomicrobiota bacterium]